ncbi:MAG TPA: hypothetical protein VFS43_22265 [Polyangiaceae bacterium]|nr:hypothetical protein [Polyangiaceae bacterium]
MSPPAARRPPRRRLAALAALAAGACSGDGDEGPAERVAYTVAFPSIAAAVAAEELQIRAYPDEGPSTCLSLVQKRRSQQALPEAASPLVTVAPCGVQGGGDGAAIETALGRFALLVVARRQGADFLIGCAVQEVAEGVEPVRVPLTLFSNTVVVPPTTCASLSSRCSNGC